MEKVTGVPGEHMTREQTLDGVEAIIGKGEATTADIEEYAEKNPIAAGAAGESDDDRFRRSQQGK